MNGRNLVMARDGFRLYMGNPIPRPGESIMFCRVNVPYELFDDEWLGDEPIFEGKEFSPSPSMSSDGDRPIACLLGFLSTKEGDADEYFEDYSPRQLEWRDARAEDLSLIACEAEEAMRESESDVAVIVDLADDGTLDTVFSVFDCMTGETREERYSSEWIRFEDEAEDEESLRDVMAEIREGNWWVREDTLDRIEAEHE